MGLDLGAARVRIRSDVRGLADVFTHVYAGYPRETPAGFFDATVEVRHARGIRRHFRPQIHYIVDAGRPFDPFPAANHLPMLEWGMNFALAERFLHSLLLHAGVVAREGKAVLLPAIPGSGKSTLTAALMCRGFTLLSDEFGVVDLDSGDLRALVRPVALKNESIAVIGQRFPQATLGPAFDKTRKGRVAHLAPSAQSIAARKRVSRPRLIVFPQFIRDAALHLEPVDAATAFGKLCVNSFNYELLGPRGFDAVARLIRECRFHRIRFGDMDQAVDAISDLLDATP